MLRQLAIENFAIIDRLSLDLAEGLNSLTGETGAGKSIVIDAVSSLLGSRLGPEFIRTGAEQAYVEGIFDVPASGPAAAYLSEQELASDDGSAIVSRTIHRSGRSVARVNGRAVPAAVLQELGRRLIDVHGQTEHLSLLRVAEHVEFLDGYAGLKEQRREVAARVAALRAIRRDIAALQQDEREAARRADLLSFQVEEIAAARLLSRGPDESSEEDELRRERNRLANAERLSAAANSAYRLLYEGDDEARAALDLLGDVAGELADLGRLDPAAAVHSKTIEDVSYRLEDLARELRAYRDEIEFNPARLEEVEERLDLMKNLKRKYGGTIAEVVAFAERAAAELEGIEHRDERLAELRGRERDCLVEAGRLAESLSVARSEAAAGLSSAIEGELAELNMRRARFTVEIRRSPDPDGLPFADGQTYAFDAAGADRVEFFIATNPGEPPKPLAKIASGGETSRLMLALKSILARADLVPVLIFDEIDVGIGGRSGYVVGQKLAGLASERQVICVTHLPQIAAFGDRHFQIAKVVEGERTATRIRALDDDERGRELAVMLGGMDDSAQALANARELLDRAAEWKRTNRN